VNRLEIIDIKISGELAWVVYHNYAEWKNEETVKSKAHWLETAVLFRTIDGWKIQLLHSTYIYDK